MKCLNPKCERPEKVRGLCWPCYQTARRLVARKETSWSKLLAAGRVTSGKRGKKKSTANWLLTGSHIDELEFQETGKMTPPNAAGERQPAENLKP